MALLNSLAEIQIQAFGITKQNSEGSVIMDQTHSNYKGWYIFDCIVAEAIAYKLGTLRP